jgi:hypothetical protein
MKIKTLLILLLPIAGVFALPMVLRSVGGIPFQSSSVLSVDAGPDINATGIPGQSTPVTLSGTVKESGILQPGVSVQWSKVSGPGELTVDDPGRAITTGHLSQPGQYLLRLTANDYAPTAIISNPADGASYKSQVTIRASATDDVGVTKMELYIDGVLFPSTTTLSGKTASSCVTWNLTPKKYAYGTHAIELIAQDAVGHRSWAGVNILKVK